MKKNEQDIYRAFGDSEPHQGVRNKKMIREAVILISNELAVLKGDEGTVIFPAEMHPRDVHSLRGDRSGVGSRIGFVVPIPFGEGMGTLIQIRARKK